MPPARPEHLRDPLRGARAAVFALAALLLASTAHLAGGGKLPSFPLLVLLAVPLAWGAVALTGRRRGRLVLLAALGGAQLGLHEAFMALSGPACPVVAPAGAMAGMHGMTSMTGAQALCTTGGVAGMGAHAAVPTAMVLAHVVATVATALLLAYGERLLACLPALLLPRATRRVAAAVFPVLPRPGRAPRTVPRRAPDFVAGPTWRRGPPAPRGVAVPA